MMLWGGRRGGAWGFLLRVNANKQQQQQRTNDNEAKKSDSSGTTNSFVE